MLRIDMMRVDMLRVGHVESVHVESGRVESAHVESARVDVLRVDVLREDMLRVDMLRVDMFNTAGFVRSLNCKFMRFSFSSLSRKVDALQVSSVVVFPAHLLDIVSNMFIFFCAGLDFQTFGTLLAVVS